MHGYEIIKVLEARYKGFYRPSAGTIYPALRTLLKQRRVAVEGGERRKVYRITAAGRRYLGSRRAEIQARHKAFEASVGPERAALLRELRETGRLVWTRLPNVSRTQAKAVRQIMANARKEIYRILTE